MCLLAPHFREMTKTEKYSVQRVLMPPKMALLPLPFRAKELVYTHLSVTSFRVFAKIVENLIISHEQRCAASFTAESAKPIRI